MATSSYTRDFYDDMAGIVDPNDLVKVMDDFSAKMAKDAIANSRLIRKKPEGEDRMASVCEVRYMIVFLLQGDEAIAYKIMRYSTRLRNTILDYEPLD